MHVYDSNKKRLNQLIETASLLYYPISIILLLKDQGSGALIASGK